MNKIVQYLTLSIWVGMQTSTAFAALSADEIKKNLDTWYQNTFLNPKPLLQKLNPRNIPEWYYVVENVEEFAKNNITLDKDLTNGMATLKNANKVIVGTIDEWNKLMVAGKGSPSAKQASATLLSKTLEELRTLNAKLEKKKPILPGNKKTNEILIKLANYLAGAASIAQQELGKTVEEFKQIILSARTRAFGVDNLVEKRLDAQGIQVWNQAVDTAIQYAKDNITSFQNLSSQQSTMVQALINIIKHIKTENDKLINAINLAQQALARSKAIEVAQKYIIQLEDIENILARLLANLNNNIMRGYSTPGNQRAADVLYYLGNNVKELAGIAQNHVKKMVSL